jgi:PrtD family type I secretion system ABC transporter
VKGNHDSVLRAELRALTPAYFGILTLSGIIPLLILTIPLYMMQVHGRVLLSKNYTTLLFLFLIALFLLAVWAILNELRARTLSRIGNDLDGRISQKVFAAANAPSAPLSPASRARILGDVEQLRAAMSSPVAAAILDSVWTPLLIITLFLIHKWLGYAALLILAAYVLLALINQWVVKRISSHLQECLLRTNEWALAVNRSSDTICALGMMDRVTGRWYQLRQGVLGWQDRTASRTSFVRAITQYLRLSEWILMFTLGAYLVLANELDVGGMWAGVIIHRYGLRPVETVMFGWSVIVNGYASYGRLEQLLGSPDDTEQVLRLPSPSGALRASRVTVVAPGREQPLLNDVSFSIEPGRVLGVGGPSGAGKSSLARVLAGVWQPTRGNVSIGDHDLSHWDPEDLGQYIGYVAQDIELLPGTVAENISRYQAGIGASSKPVIAAGELAGIQDIIRGLPDGYNTDIGPSGLTLSGGQRQRIALARAVYGEPRVIVLDEPNSNLDAKGEQALIAAIRHLRTSGATTVLVTHKVNLLAICDDILILNGGVVYAFGTREAIMKRIPSNKWPLLQASDGSAGAFRGAPA